MLRFNKNKIVGKTAKIHSADKKLIIIVFIIVVFGLICLSSASSVFSYNKFGDAYFFLKNQLFGFFLGLAAFIFLANIDYHIWKKYALGFLIFSILLLILVFIPGLRAEYGSARSWINIFGHSLQPSEFVKLSFLFYLTAWLEAKKENLKEFFHGTMPFFAVLSVISLLMILQPDMGTLFIIAITSLVVFFVGGGSIKYILASLLIGVVAFSAMILINPYQFNRFKCVFNPGFDLQNKCYQTNQSLIAVGSGGLFGRGLGASRQKYMYVPEVQGDSIFAIIAEEMGLIISSLLVFCYIYLFYRGYIIAKYAPDDFGKTLAIGIVSWLTIQTIINIGGIIGLMPMTGVPLPLISYGGSAILTSLASIGILVNISKQTKAGNY
jgi:cell division protein FtsW